MDLKKILEKAKSLSICNERKEYKKNFKEISKRGASLLMALTMSLSLTACSKDKNISKNNESESSYEEITDYDSKTISAYVSSKIYRADAQLKLANIRYCDEYGRILTNDLDTYKNIQDLNEDDLIGYYKVLGQEESNKILNLLGYSGWNDYLIKHGFVDKNGQPDIKIWEENVYIQMQINAEKGVMKR